MRGSPPSGPARGPWSVARLQRIGNWGRADEAIGRRWEAVGLEALATLLHRERQGEGAPYTPAAILALAADDALRQEVHASGLPNPDAALLGRRPDGTAVIQPVDFKWSLERAERPQVAGATLERLLAAPLPRLHAALEQTVGAAGVARAALVYVDGFFFAPEHAENRAWLASAANARSEYPLALEDVEFWPVAPRAFFAPLPGWELGCWLAELDRSVRLLDTIEGAERYYRLGDGFQGALVRLATPLFADAPAPVDARAEIARLRAQHRLYTSAELATYLERQMAARETLQRALRELEAAVYPFRLFRAEVEARRGAPGDGEPLAEENGAPGLREGYRAVRAAVRAYLREQGQALVARGLPEAQALAELQARLPALTQQARTLARRYLDAQER